MERRVEELETHLREIHGLVSAMDSKLGSLVQLIEKGQRRVDSFMNEIRTFMVKEVSGKGPATVAQSLEVGDEHQTEQIPYSYQVATSGSSRELRTGGQGDGGQRGLYHRRLELPTFVGDDPFGWVVRIERYFTIDGITENERVNAAWACFEGAALGWFQFRQLNTPIRSWGELREELLKRFGAGQLRTPQEELVTLRQTGTVADYRERFEWLAAATQTREDQEWLKSIFIAGLGEEIRAEIRLFGPDSMDELMQLAQAIEAREIGVINN